MNIGQAARKAIDTGIDQISVTERDVWFYGPEKKVLRGFFCIVGKHGCKSPYQRYYELIE